MTVALAARALEIIDLAVGVALQQTHGIVKGELEQKPRWRRVAATTDELIGEALGQLYVAEYFPPEAKARRRPNEQARASH